MSKYEIEKARENFELGKDNGKQERVANVFLLTACENFEKAYRKLPDIVINKIKEEIDALCPYSMVGVSELEKIFKKISNELKRS